MNRTELIAELTEICIRQAKIIEAQAGALAQLDAVVELDGRIEAAARERAAIFGEGCESGPLFTEVNANDAE